MNEIRTLARQSSHYLLGRVGTMLLGFVSFPLYTRLLSVAHYGILNLAQQVVLLGIAVSKLGLQTALLRFYEEHRPAERDLKRLYSTTLFGAFLGALPATAVYVLVLVALSARLVSAGLTAALLATSGLLVVRAIQSVVLGILRVEGRTKAYNVVDVITRAATIGIGVSLLLAWERTPRALLWSITLAEALVMAGAWVLLLPRRLISPGGFDTPLFRRSLAYGLPLVGAELATILLGSSDRVLIQYFLGSEQLGYYAAAIAIATYAEEMIQVPMNLALLPIYLNIWATKGKAETQRFLSLTLDYYVMGAVAIVGLLLSTSRELMVLLGSLKYLPAHPLLPPLLAGMFLYASSIFFNAGLMISKKTARLASLIFICALFRILLNILLLPRIGLWGAVAANVAGYVLLIALLIHASRGLLPLRADLRAWSLYALAALAASAATWRLELGGPLASLVAKALAGGVVYASLLYLVDRRVRQFVRIALGRLDLRSQRPGAPR